MRANRGWWIVSGVAVMAVAVVGWQIATAAELRAQITRERANNAGWVEAAVARRLAAERSLGEHQASSELIELARAEAIALRQQVEAAARAAEKEAAHRFAPGNVMPMAEWKNAGAGTAQAALETVLWAGANGDVDTLARSLLMINGKTRAAAQTLLDSLPEAIRRQHDSPERLIAFLTIKDVPLGAAEVRRSPNLEGWPAPARQMEVLLTGEDGKHKDVHLLFMKPGEDWKLVVTESVVSKYAAALKAPSPGSGK